MEDVDFSQMDDAQLAYLTAGLVNQAKAITDQANAAKSELRRRAGRGTHRYGAVEVKVIAYSRFDADKAEKKLSAADLKKVTVTVVDRVKAQALAKLSTKYDYDADFCKQYDDQVRITIKE